MAARYSAETGGDVSLSAATAKTILNIINGTNALIRIIELSVSFDGTSSTATPVVVELCKSTQAGNGTGSSSVTIVQSGGPTRTVQATAAKNYSTEPTTLTTIKRWRVHPQTGILLQEPLGREDSQTASANALALRITAAAAVNAQAYVIFEEG